MKTAVIIFLLAGCSVFADQSTSTAANAINSFGVDLLRKTAKPADNALLSPYSIQTALAMTYAGAAGVTHDEMERVLHFPKDDTALHDSLENLRKALEEEAARQKEPPTILAVANRLFGQSGYDFRPAFLGTMKTKYNAPFEAMDFRTAAPAATKRINSWVEEQTRDRIRDLIPDGALNKDTRLVLVNALYMKAPWADAFSKGETSSQPFHINGGSAAKVPMMRKQERHLFGYDKQRGFTVVTIPYYSWGLQFTVLLPDANDGLEALRAKLTPEILAQCTNLKQRDVILTLPKFKMTPPAISLSRDLQALGMRTAFDRPVGSANFDRMAPRLPDRYLYISDVFHKTFVSVDEQGTEAAAATAVHMAEASAIAEPSKPIEVKVDHPFLFAIQHRSSGACLFVGQVNDPR